MEEKTGKKRKNLGLIITGLTLLATVLGLLFGDNWYGRFKGAVSSLRSASGNNSELFFSDVKTGDWCRDAVEYLFDRGLIAGVGENQFAPDKTAKRAMVAEILYRAEGEPKFENAVDFDDMRRDMYYSNAVAWAAGNGIMMGNNGNVFDPEADITREQIASILYRYHVAYKGRPAANADSGLLAYLDRRSVSEYAVSGVAWAIENGLFRDIIDGKAILPQSTVTRAEAAVMFARYLQKY